MWSSLRRDSRHALGQRHALTMVAAGVVLYAAGPVLIGSGDASGPVLSFWRLWFGVATLGLAAAIGIRMGARRPGWQGWRWALWGGLAFGAHQLLFFSAIRAAGVTDVVLMNVLTPIFVAFAAVPLFGERTSVRFRLWSLLAMAGAALVITGGAAGPDGSPAGMAMAVANVVMFGSYFLISKLGREQIDVLPFLFGSLVVAAIAVSAWCVMLDEPVGSPTSWDLRVALLLAVGPGGLGHFAMTWPLKWVPANVPPVMRLVQPVISGGLAWALLAEPITLAHLGGGTLTFLGVFGSMRARPPSRPG